MPNEWTNPDIRKVLALHEKEYRNATGKEEKAKVIDKVKPDVRVYLKPHQTFSDNKLKEVSRKEQKHYLATELIVTENRQLVHQLRQLQVQQDGSRASWAPWILDRSKCHSTLPQEAGHAILC